MVLKERLIGMAPRPDEEALRNGQIIRHLARRATYDASAAEYMPRFLRMALETGAWRHYANPDTNEVFDHEDFAEFVTSPWPRGLKIDGGVPQLIRTCEVMKGDDALWSAAKMREIIPAEGKHGGKREAKRPDVISLRPKQYGTSAAFTLARLKRDRPDLADKVVRGECSANRAAIEAGFRERTVQIRPTVEGFLRAAAKHLTRPQRRQLWKRLA